jgi:hypothetical protein
VLSEKTILNETKNHNTPLQVKWSVPKDKIRDKKTLFEFGFWITINTSSQELFTEYKISYLKCWNDIKEFNIYTNDNTYKKGLFVIR